jgi:hypothetical protein
MPWPGCASTTGGRPRRGGSSSGRSSPSPVTAVPRSWQLMYRPARGQHHHDLPAPRRAGAAQDRRPDAPRARRRHVPPGISRPRPLVCERCGSVEATEDLGQRAAHRVRRARHLPVAFQDGHDQAHRLSGSEHQRREPQATPHPMAPMGTADRLDRKIGLPQDRDVATDSPFCNPKPFPSLRRDAGAVLDRLQYQQCPRGGGLTECAIPFPIPEPDRPEPTLACLHGQ